MNDKQSCADIDECEGRGPGVCSHLCINTLGSYQCDCHPGYVMETGGHSCKITGKVFLMDILGLVFASLGNPLFRQLY